jgi:HEAT repeat protein
MSLDDLFDSAAKVDLKRYESRQLSLSDLHELVDLMYSTFDANKSIERLLAQADQAVIASGLEELVRIGDPEAKCNAADMLARLNLPPAIRCVDILLEDSDVDVRCAGCRILSTIEGPDSLSRLVHYLQSDPSELVRYIALDGVEMLGDAALIPILQRVAERDAGCDYEGRPIREKALQVIDRLSPS